MRKLQKKIKASEFDKAFDERKDVVPFLDVSSAKVRFTVQRINIDIPQDILKKVDQEACRVGVPRTSLIKMWIAERLEALRKSA